VSGLRINGGIAIDRSRPINFRWAGKSYQGFAGDTGLRKKGHVLDKATRDGVTCYSILAAA